jgi:hypothetical protein
MPELKPLSLPFSFPEPGTAPHPPTPPTWHHSNGAARCCLCSPQQRRQHSVTRRGHKLAGERPVLPLHC